MYYVLLGLILLACLTLLWALGMIRASSKRDKEIMKMSEEYKKQVRIFDSTRAYLESQYGVDDYKDGK